MDFTLSLAHFCELHGPTSVICTQTLATNCDRCYPSSYNSTPLSANDGHESYFAQQAGRRFSLAPHLGKVGDGERCDSCSIRSPPQAKKNANDSIFITKEKAVPFRTRENIHICAEAADSDDEETNHSARCHDHNVEYVSSSSPVEPEVFVALRNATVRTLSGEQLPKGQRSGPLCFGDSATGYTVAYYFRLADGHARGKERYYALLALVGTETKRAFESCTLIWNLFEQIALHVISMAEEVLQKNKPRVEIDKAEKEHVVAPVSSFLTQRTLDPDGVPRRGAESFRANNITDLVENVNFFCELHMMFVKMLQELGKMFGGMKINPKPEASHLLQGSERKLGNSADVKTPGDHEDEDFRMSPVPQDHDASRFSDQTVTTFNVPDHSTITPSPSPKRQAVLG